MMKQEFENLLGYELSPEQYDKIEKVCMAMQKMSKEAIVDLYKHDEFFDILYNYVAKVTKEIRELSINLVECDLEHDCEIASLEEQLFCCADTIDELNALSDISDTEFTKLKAENDELKDIIDIRDASILNLKLEIDRLKKESEYFKKRVIKYGNEMDRLEEENEELQAQLNQYQALFADTGSHMVVSLHESLLGTANN